MKHRTRAARFDQEYWQRKRQIAEANNIKPGHQVVVLSTWGNWAGTVVGIVRHGGEVYCQLNAMEEDRPVRQQVLVISGLSYLADTPPKVHQAPSRACRRVDLTTGLNLDLWLSASSTKTRPPAP